MPQDLFSFLTTATCGPEDQGCSATISSALQLGVKKATNPFHGQENTLERYSLVVARWLLKEHSICRQAESAPRRSAQGCVNILPLEHSDLEAAVLMMDGCMSRGSTSVPLTPGIQTPGVAKQVCSARKVWSKMGTLWGQTFWHLVWLAIIPSR